jgi:hypothetical protein
LIELCVPEPPEPLLKRKLPFCALDSMKVLPVDVDPGTFSVA